TACVGRTTPNSVIPLPQIAPFVLHFVPLFSFKGGKYGASTVGGGGGIAGLIGDPMKALYGVNDNGGDATGFCAKKFFAGQGCGLVYALIPDATAIYHEQILHTFTGPPDGALPFGTLLQVGTDLYGTTGYGGDAACFKVGCGTVFKLTPSGTRYDESILHTFKNTGDGAFPFAALIADSQGNLYGTTRGGANLIGRGYGYGTVFELVASESYKVRTLYRFQGGSDGASPVTTLVTIDKSVFRDHAARQPRVVQRHRLRHRF
ncbi:MAG: hypothetical protein JO302_02040, partial [Candidatus Eremiobacteraeota bacterium]|nr:hypothetical protein [Candidatus Eremiobacteraeota bacterium]